MTTRAYRFDVARFSRAALGVGALAWLLGCEQSAPPQAAPAPPPVTTARPVVKNIVETDEFVGRFEPIEQVELRARATGFLDSVHFKDGGIVESGALLFVLDKRIYEADLARAEANLRAIQTRLDFARSDLTRAEQLSRQGATAERVVDERRQAFLSAQADQAAAQAAVDSARIALDFTEIRAPISGRISRKLVNEGNLVRANETVLTTIVALDPIHFYFDVDERTYLAYARMGLAGTRPSGREQRYEIMISLADEKTASHRGNMDFVDNRLDPATGTMRGRALVENRDQLLVPGLFGRIHIPGSGSYRAVLIPDEAIVADQDRRLVWVVAGDGTVSARPIRPGPRHDGYRIVRQGLTGEETIVVAGVQRVRGGRVTPLLVELPATR